MKKIRKRQGTRLAVRVLLAVYMGCFMLFLLAYPIYAESTVGLPEEYSNLQESLPDEVTSYLPDGMFSENIEENADALTKTISPQYIFGILEEMIGSTVGEGLRLFLVLCGLLVLSAVFQNVRTTISSPALQNVVRFCTVGAVFATLIRLQYRHLEAVSLFFDRLQALMLGMIPVGSVLLAMGGNVSTASTGSATLGVFLSVSENLCAATVIPVSCIGTALAFCNAFSPEIGLRGLSSAIRKTYVFFLGLIMTILSAILAAQTTLGAAADSVGARTARLVSSTVIPVVGGTVGDTLRTVGTSMQYLKSIAGISGIVLLCLLLLPTLLSLIVTRLCFLLSSGVAEMLGCETEGRLLSELGTVWGTMIAVVSMCSIMFLLALTLLIRVGVAAA